MRQPADIPTEAAEAHHAVDGWERILLAHLRTCVGVDTAHDVGHLGRVLSVARKIAAEEGAHDELALTAASLLHDCVAVSKDSPMRSKASLLAAREAMRLLSDMGFPSASLDAVFHAIEAHSHSASVKPLTPEARAVQDADRIEALGAIGVARCFAVGGGIGRGIFDPADPLARDRPLDDLEWSLDHFQVKLLGLPDTMTTASGRRIAGDRARFLQSFMLRLAEEAIGRA